MSRPDAEAPVVVFDGTCALCGAGVNHVLAHERPDGPPIRFVAIQSEEGARLAAVHGIDARDPETFLFVEGGRSLMRSDAALAVAGHLDGPARLVQLGRWLPRPLRDAAYGLLARHRHRLFGRGRVAPGPERRGRVVPPPEGS